MGRRKKYKADILLLTGLLAAGLILALALALTRQTGGTVEVRVAGELVKCFPLSEDVTYEIIGADGGGNLLIIRDGAAWIEEADCPDALCVGMGRIRRSGQSVVCLPHQVVVEITGAADDGGVDATVG